MAKRTPKVCTTEYARVLIGLVYNPKQKSWDTK